MHHGEKTLVTFARAAAVFLAGCTLSTPSAAQEVHAGEALYKRICFICHDSGMYLHGAQGAPRLGNRKAWERRVKKGIEALTDSVLTGRDGNIQMPTAGMSREEIRAAVSYMLHMADGDIEAEAAQGKQTSVQ